jgi:hypothetical protein
VVTVYGNSNVVVVVVVVAFVIVVFIIIDVVTIVIITVACLELIYCGILLLHFKAHRNGCSVKF